MAITKSTPLFLGGVVLWAPPFYVRSKILSFSYFLSHQKPLPATPNRFKSDTNHQPPLFQIGGGQAKHKDMIHKTHNSNINLRPIPSPPLAAAVAAANRCHRLCFVIAHVVTVPSPFVVPIFAYPPAMDQSVDGQSDGCGGEWIDEQFDGLIDGQGDERDGWADGREDGSWCERGHGWGEVGATAGAMGGTMEWKTDQATVGAMDRSMDGAMDGLMDGWSNRWSE